MNDRLEKALQERTQLTRAYRVAKRAQFERAYAAEPRLRDFARTVKACGIEDAEKMIALCRQAWLNCTDPETRACALEIIDLRIIQIRMRAGLAPIDDALPGEADDIFQLCRRILT